VAILFTGLGAWAGRRLTLGTRRPSPFEENRRAVDTLGISDRELELLGLLAEGCSNKEIARRASISVNTVKTHLSSLYGKLDVSRRTQAVRKARELRILP
jgi:ATP/maltotriose-dependent transcriptional regulator MalT